MQAKSLEREQAIALRRQGLSYREIRGQIPVAKSTLSLWLRQVGLAKAQRQRLTQRKLAAAIRGSKKLHAQWLARVASIHSAAMREGVELLRTGDVMWAIGTALYWAEGAKTKPWRTHTRFQFTNTDPVTIALVRSWLQRYCGVDDADIHFDICIHENADVESARIHWMRTLNIAENRLRIYFKRHNPDPRRYNVGRTYYGTMRMTVKKSTALSHRIEGWIGAIAARCGVV
jgi:hypothetical protein